MLSTSVALTPRRRSYSVKRVVLLFSGRAHPPEHRTGQETPSPARVRARARTAPSDRTHPQRPLCPFARRTLPRLARSPRRTERTAALRREVAGVRGAKTHPYPTGKSASARSIKVDNSAPACAGRDVIEITRIQSVADPHAEDGGGCGRGEDLQMIGGLTRVDPERG